MRRSGFALLFALIALVLIEAMTAGALVLGTHARVVAESEARAARAQAEAEFAVQAIVGRWSSASFDTLAVGGRLVVPPVSTIERVSPSLYMVHAEARAGDVREYAVGHATAMARTLDRGLMLAESNQAVSTAGPLTVGSAARFSASTSTLPPSWTSAQCASSEPLPDPMVVSIDSISSPADSIAMAGARWSELASIADRTESGVVTAAPAEEVGICIKESPGNWGDPRDPAAACAGYFPFIYSAGDLIMNGGVGQGVLAAQGRVLIQNGALFVGLIVAARGVTAESGARVYGAIRSQAYATFEDSMIEYSRCALSRVSVGTQATRRVIMQQRRFIPAF